jgi:helix-turn-helix protein
MWTLFEPIHAVTYFAPEARSAFEQAGLRGFWRGYFAGRGAPLGAASAAVVTASFFNFAPAFVARAIPGVWELITPDEAVRIRTAGATEALQGLLAGQEADAAAAADLLWRAIGELDL